jgi:hypothetical protein
VKTTIILTVLHVLLATDGACSPSMALSKPKPAYIETEA